MSEKDRKKQFRITNLRLHVNKMALEDEINQKKEELEKQKKGKREQERAKAEEVIVNAFATDLREYGSGKSVLSLAREHGINLSNEQIERCLDRFSVFPRMSGDYTLMASYYREINQPDLAKKCEDWCKKHNSCSLEITRHSVEAQKQKILYINFA